MDRLRWTEISGQEIDLLSLTNKIGHPENGAQVIFTGTVRSKNDGKKVITVSYDVHESLALKCFDEICEEAARLSSGPLQMMVVHRKGVLKVGEISIFIGVSSPHRAEAFEASRYIIEKIKKCAPIWKKEHYEDGETEWLKGHALCQH
jgi:molybdopterin synthase catalytic subunit